MGNMEGGKASDRGRFPLRQPDCRIAFVTVPTKSAHHRDLLTRASVRLTIDRDARRQRQSGRDVLFPAQDEAGASVTVALSSSAWTTMSGDGLADPIGELEQLALSGAWEPHGAGRVWRVILI